MYNYVLVYISLRDRAIDRWGNYILCNFYLQFEYFPKGIKVFVRQETFIKIIR